MKYVITLNGRTYEVEAETAEPLPIDQYDGVYTSESIEQSVCVDCREQTSSPSGTDSPAEGDTVAAPMPGTIVKINVSVGDAVKKRLCPACAGSYENGKRNRCGKRRSGRAYSYKQRLRGGSKHSAACFEVSK